MSFPQKAYPLQHLNDRAAGRRRHGGLAKQRQASTDSMHGCAARRQPWRPTVGNN